MQLQDRILESDTFFELPRAHLWALLLKEMKAMQRVVDEPSRPEPLVDGCWLGGDTEMRFDRLLEMLKYYFKFIYFLMMMINDALIYTKTGTNQKSPEKLSAGIRGCMTVRWSGGGGDGILMAELPYLISLQHRRHQPLPVVPRRWRQHLDLIVTWDSRKKRENM